MQVIAESIDYLVAHYNEPLTLDFLAGRAGYEVTHFQKLFKEKVGITPKNLQQYMRARYAKELLSAGHGLFDAAHKSGLSGTGRLHDLFVSIEGVTPGQVRYKGRGLDITYGFHATPLGEILVAQTGRGVCYLGFIVDEARDLPVKKMQKHFPFANFQESAITTGPAAQQVINIWRGAAGAEKLRLDLHGTNMQVQVWRALLSIPRGEAVTYKKIAGDIGRPKASRAVGNAVGANPVSLLIPCHRVIRASGIIDNYGWGSARKKLILALESAIDD